MVFDGNMMMYWLIKVVIINLNGNFVVNVFIIYISKVRSKNKLILIYFFRNFLLKLNLNIKYVVVIYFIFLDLFVGLLIVRDGDNNVLLNVGF